MTVSLIIILSNRVTACSTPGPHNSGGESSQRVLCRTDTVETSADPGGQKKGQLAKLYWF